MRELCRLGDWRASTFAWKMGANEKGDLRGAIGHSRGRRSGGIVVFGGSRELCGCSDSPSSSHL